MLKIPDVVSETLFKVLDKVCTTFGASENSLSDGELTYQKVCVFCVFFFFVFFVVVVFIYF